MAITNSDRARGQYRTTAEAPGFSKTIAPDITVNVSARQRLDRRSVCRSWNATTGICAQGSFGTITNTFDPRLIQLGLKLSF